MAHGGADVQSACLGLQTLGIFFFYFVFLKTHLAWHVIADDAGMQGYPQSHTGVCPARSTNQRLDESARSYELEVPPAPSSEALRIAVVLNMDADYDKEPNHFDRIPVNDLVSAWTCYCLLHGYAFFLDHTRYPHLDGRANTHHIASTRIAAVLKYLDYFDYVVPVSLDTVVVNRSYRFEEFLHGRPDVVISARDHVWQWSWVRNCNFGDFHTDDFWPRRLFPERPSMMAHPPMLHTEVLFIKNSAAGRDFVCTVWRHADLFDEMDMCAIQQAALESVRPETDDVRVAKHFGQSLKSGRCTNLTDYFGYKHAWCGEFRRPPLPRIKLMYLKLSTEALVQRTDWLTTSGGHLRISREAEFLRDWAVGKLMHGGDFIVHTKRFFDNKLTRRLGGMCATDGSIPVVPHPELFAGPQASYKIAVTNGYSLPAAFAKAGAISVSGHESSCLD